MKKLSKHITESFQEVTESKVDNIDLNANLSKSDFGKLVKDVKEIKKGSKLIIHDGGMNEWIGVYKVSIKGYEYTMTSTAQFDESNEFEMSESELHDEVAANHVYFAK